MKACKCSHCKRSRRIKRTIRQQDARSLTELVEELHGILCDVEEDLSYHKVIMDGSWPSAVEQLERALAKANAMRAGVHRP